MTTFAASLTRLLRGGAVTYSHAHVHFHHGAGGVFVCDHPRCDSPGLDVAAA